MTRAKTDPSPAAAPVPAVTTPAVTVPGATLAGATLADHQARILRALVFIDDHRGEELTLEQLARVACFSPYHFHRVFAAHVGESVGAYVRRVRLDAAATSLSFEDTPITRIAMDAGYDTPGAFTRAFSQKFNLSPSAFRKRMRARHRTSPMSLKTPNLENIMQPELRTVPDRPVVFVRRTGDYNQSSGAAWSAICGWAFPRGLVGPDSRFIGVSHDDPRITTSEQLRYDACITVDRPVTPEGEVGFRVLAGGRTAVFLHQGPYAELHRTYEAIYGAWLPASGEELADAPCYEIYLNTPDNTAPADLRTEICIPLK